VVLANKHRHAAGGTSSYGEHNVGGDIALMERATFLKEQCRAPQGKEDADFG